MPGWRYLRFAAFVIAAGAWIAAAAWGLGRATEVSWLLWLEHWTGDIRTALLSHRPKRQHDRIALVTINDDTMQPYTYRSPIDRRLLADLVTAIDKAGAEAIGLDFLFLKPTEKRARTRNWSMRCARPASSSQQPIAASKCDRPKPTIKSSS